MAPISLVSILPVYSGVNTRKQNRCHAPLLSHYSSTSKCLLTRKCDVALKWYCIIHVAMHVSDQRNKPHHNMYRVAEFQQHFLITWSTLVSLSWTGTDKILWIMVYQLTIFTTDTIAHCHNDNHHNDAHPYHQRSNKHKLVIIFINCFTYVHIKHIICIMYEVKNKLFGKNLIKLELHKTT